MCPPKIVYLAAQPVLDQMTAVENRLSAELFGNSGHELPRLAQCHPLVFKVERHQRLVVRLCRRQEIIHLLGDIHAGAPMVGAPEQSRLDRGRATITVFLVLPGRAGGRLVNDRADAEVGGLLKARHPISVIEVDDLQADGGGHDSPPIDRLSTAHRALSATAKRSRSNGAQSKQLSIKAGAAPIFAFAAEWVRFARFFKTS